jgi:hypothetical protein
VTIVLGLTNCNNSNSKPVLVIDTLKSNEPEKKIEEKYEDNPKTISSACIFDNPDTSLSDIKLRDAKSATIILGVTKLNGDTTYNFYSKDKKEILGVTVHPGDYYSQISIFQVKYADKSNQAIVSKIDNFKTEKGIRLGLTKKEITARLGNCYSVTDSTKYSYVINYRLEDPNDSKTKLLERQNMPIYYATYKLKSDKLVYYEFGFEYP